MLACHAAQRPPHLHVLQHDLDCGEHDGGVGVLQAGQHTLHHALCVLGVGGKVVDHRVQDEDLVGWVGGRTQDVLIAAAGDTHRQGSRCGRHGVAGDPG
jgi:hypothetical protein